VAVPIRRTGPTSTTRRDFYHAVPTCPPAPHSSVPSRIKAGAHQRRPPARRRVGRAG
jgi:hypothetical protein